MVGVPHRSGGNRSTLGTDPAPRDAGPVADGSLTDAERDTFFELVGRLPTGVLRAVDSYQLAALARLIEREKWVAVAVANDPENLQLARLQVSIIGQLSRCSAMFGLSPADRRRLSLSPDESLEPNPMVDIMARMGRF